MGLFDMLFTDKAKEKSQQEEKRTSTGTRKAVTTGEEAVVESGTEVTQLLSDPVRKGLEDVLLGMTSMITEAGGDPGEVDEISQILFERAKTAEEDVRASSQAIIEDERLVGQRALTRLTTDIGQEAGGVGTKSSSFVAGATAEGEALLASNLARLSAELDIGARTLATDEFVKAREGFALAQEGEKAELGSITELANVLRGAVATTTTEAEKGTERFEATDERLSELVESIITGTRESEETGGLFKTLFPKGFSK